MSYALPAMTRLSAPQPFLLLRFGAVWADKTSVRTRSFKARRSSLAPSP